MEATSELTSTLRLPALAVPVRAHVHACVRVSERACASVCAVGARGVALFALLACSRLVSSRVCVTGRCSHPRPCVVVLHRSWRP